MVPALRRTLRPTLLALAVTGSLAAAPAGAHPHPHTATGPVTLDGVRTSLLTNAATTAVLVKAGVGVEAVGGIRTAVVRSHKGTQLRFRFPITTGSVNPSSLAGTIDHSGGLRFVTRATGASLTVSDFRIDTTTGLLSAAVNGDPAVRAPILSLDLSDIDVVRSGRTVRIINVRTRLTATAATALNGSLGTSLFAEGIYLGNANVLASVAR